MFLGAGGLLAVYIARLVTMSRVEVLRSDYLSVDTAGHLVRMGLGSQLYTEAVQGPVYSSLAAGDHAGDLLFNHAPLSAALAVPFSLLGQVPGHAAWSGLQLAMVAAACLLATRAAAWPLFVPRLGIVGAVLLALAGAGTLPLILQGQEVGEITLGLAVAYFLWRRQHLALGGGALVMGAAFAKPHLALGLVAFVIGWRERRLVAGALAGGAASVGLFVLVAGWHGVIGFLGAAMHSVSISPETLQSGFTGLFSTLFGSGGLSTVATVFATLIALAGCVLLGRLVRRDRTRLPLALTSAAALSLLAAPHVLSHDLVLLAPALVAILAPLSVRDGPAAQWPGPRVRLAIGAWLMLVAAAGVDSSVTLPLKLTSIALALFAWFSWRWSTWTGTPTQRVLATEAGREGEIRTRDVTIPNPVL